FVMLKPSMIYCIVGAYMLRPGWMTRYLPPIAVQTVPDLAWIFGFVWAGLMFGSAALNIVLALTLDPIAWSATMSIWGIASKVALFLVQYVTMRAIGTRRGRAAAAASASTLNGLPRLSWRARRAACGPRRCPPPSCRSGRGRSARSPRCGPS